MTVPLASGGGMFGANLSSMPTLPSLHLSEDEVAIANAMAKRLIATKSALYISDLYYNAEQTIRDLGISIPPTLSGLRVVPGWGAVSVDSVVDRKSIDGFRVGDSIDSDDDLDSIWLANGLDAESDLTHLDVRVLGHAYVVVGQGDDGPDMPLITTESPYNMTAIWDPRTRSCRSGLSLYNNRNFGSDFYGQQVAALYLPGRSIFMSRNGDEPWSVIDRDDHKLLDGEFVPIVRLANNQRTGNRDGRSAITPAMRSIIDAGCRTLLGAEIGRELYAAPRRWLTGASVDMFQDSDGNKIDAWSSYMGKVWAIPGDPDSEKLPNVGQFPASDPTAYTAINDMYARQFAAIARLPADYLGLTTQGNPTSADAIRANEARLIKHVEASNRRDGRDWSDVMTFATIVKTGEKPAEPIFCDWVDASTATVAATTDAVTKQIDAGSLTPQSDVALKAYGYNSAERRRIRAENKADPGFAIIAELAQTFGVEDLIKASRAIKAGSVSAVDTEAKANQPATAA